MNRILAALLLVALSFPASAEVWEARYGVAETFNFKLYNADGTLDVDEADGGTEVSLSCNEGAETTATNDFVDEGTFYSIALTAAELQCERIAVVVAATTTEVFFIQTINHASAMTPTIEANVASATSASIEMQDFATTPGAAGGLLIAGTNADFDVTANSAFAGGLTISQSTSNAAALVVTGNGTGNGATFTSGSGATGNGISATAASTNGNGFALTGTGTGSGALATGGATGHGINGVGGATSGNGIRGAGTAGNSAAILAAGQGSASGIQATGGATGAGATFTGGATSGAGIVASATSGNGATLTGGGTGHGLSATSGSGATGNGFHAVAASTNGNGINAAGTGTGSGELATGGTTGHGFNGVGGATSGSGYRAAGTAGNSPAMTLVGQGSAAGLLATGGATGPGVSAVGGSTSGAGFSATSTSGNGMTASGGTAGHGFAATGGATGAGMSLTGGSTSGHALATAVTQPLGAVPGFGIQESGTLQSATATTAVLRAATSFPDTNPVGMTIEIVGGTGVGQSRTIDAWVSATDTATVTTWTTTPDSTSDYYVWGTSAASGGGGGGGDATAANQTLILAAIDAVDNYVDTEIATLTTRIGTPSDLGGGASLAANAADIEAQTDDIGAAGAGLTAADDSVMTRLGAPVGASISADIAGVESGISWNSSWDAEVQSEADDALVANHLNRLFAADYDPASKPGVATALLNELIGSDAGISQFTANALELAPSGGGGGTSDWNADERTAIRAILGVPASGTTPDDPTTGILDTIRDDTVDIQSRLPASLVSGRIDASVGAMAANTVTAAAAAADLTTELQSGLATSSALSTLSTDVAAIEAQTDDIGTAGAGLTAVPWNASWDAEVQSEATDALNALTIAEPNGPPAWGDPIGDWVAWIGAWNRNEIRQSTTTKTLRNDANSANLSTCAVSDNGTTLTVSECQ